MLIRFFFFHHITEAIYGLGKHTLDVDPALVVPMGKVRFSLFPSFFSLPSWRYLPVAFIPVFLPVTPPLFPHTHTHPLASTLFSIHIVI